MFTSSWKRNLESRNIREIEGIVSMSQSHQIEREGIIYSIINYSNIHKKIQKI